ncbi:GntR family transcriptional regulator [Saccharomonospora sp. NPDC046836]|uniref:GntR family transcriptional regulator n=1 Tax=Saccharomonospora sp. NPDC046836 TaxID=3156921 RepID=UPI00340C08F4
MTAGGHARWDVDTLRRSLAANPELVVLTVEQCVAVSEALADDDARQAEVMLYAARYPRATFSVDEGFTEAELRWVERIRALGEALCRVTKPRYQLDPVAAYFWQQVRDHLAARIEAGEFDRWLPNRELLALEYGVSVRTVDRAIRELAGKGLVVSFPSKGTALA